MFLHFYVHKLHAFLSFHVQLPHTAVYIKENKQGVTEGTRDGVKIKTD